MQYLNVKTLPRFTDVILQRMALSLRFVFKWKKVIIFGMC